MSYSFPAYPQLSLSHLQSSAQGCAFITSASATIASASTETPLLYLSNPANGVYSIYLFNLDLGVGSSSADCAFKLYYNPGISANGSVLSIRNLRANNSAPGSSMSAYLSPTVSSNGNLISQMNSGFPSLIDSKPYILDPGNSLLITANVTAITTPVIAQPAWFEVRF